MSLVARVEYELEGDKPFHYIMELYFFDITSEYKLIRRWRREGGKEKKIESEDFNTKDKMTFERKVIQKSIIQKWKMKEKYFSKEVKYNLLEAKGLIDAG